MAIWSLALEHDKPTLMKVKETPHGNAILWNVHTTSSDQIYTLMKSKILLRKTKIDVLEDKINSCYDRYINAMRHYDEIKRSYVLEKINIEMEK